MQKKNKCALIFHENVRFLGKTQNFSTIQNIFLCSKVLEGFKYAKKRGYQANFEKGHFSSHPNGQVVIECGKSKNTISPLHALCDSQKLLIGHNFKMYDAKEGFRVDIDL
jgi:hypothetical protein